MRLEIDVPTSPRDLIKSVSYLSQSVLGMSGMSEVAYAAKNTSAIIANEVLDFLASEALGHLVGNFPKAITGSVERQ